MLVDGKQKIPHHLALFVHQHLFISPFLFVSPEIAWKPPNISHVLWNPEKLPASDSNILGDSIEMPLLGKGGDLRTYNRFWIYRPFSSSYDPNYLYHNSSLGFVPAFLLRWY